MHSNTSLFSFCRGTDYNNETRISKEMATSEKNSDCGHMTQCSK